MSRPVAALVLAACSCVLAACGGGGSGSPAATMRGYISAIADGHAKQVCGYLTGAALQARGGGTCVRQVKRAAAHMSKKDASAIRNLKFKVVSEHGNAAAVRLYVPQASCPAGKVQTIQLVKQDGSWMISRTQDNACALTS